MKSIGGMSHGSKQIGAMSDKRQELRIGEMASKTAHKEDKKALQAHADLAKLVGRK